MTDRFDSPFAGAARVAIVGNAPDMADQASAIDAADAVMRFNNASGFGGRAGRRVTQLVLVNHGGQMREWLEDPRFLERPAVLASDAFLFPFAPKPGDADAGEDGRDWTREATRRLAALGRPLAVLPDALRRRATLALRAAAGWAATPSTGYLAAFCLLEVCRDRDVRFDVYGFGFAGWSGHDFAAERRWFEGMAARGRLRLHPLGPGR